MVVWLQSVMQNFKLLPRFTEWQSTANLLLHGFEKMNTLFLLYGNFIFRFAGFLSIIIVCLLSLISSIQNICKYRTFQNLFWWFPLLLTQVYFLLTLSIRIARYYHRCCFFNLYWIHIISYIRSLKLLLIIIPLKILT